MNVYRSMIYRNSKNAAKGLTRTPARTFAGGGKIVKMGKDVTDFDICVIGGNNATALTKFLQNEGKGLQMALITDRSKYLRPELYFLCSHAAIKPLKLETGSVGAQVDASSRTDVGVRATKIDPSNNRVHLSNGKEYTYKALILAPGFDHSTENIKGLPQFDEEGEQNNVYAHIIDNVKRLDRNYHHGQNHFGGDYIVYDPAHPYKQEGSSFSPLYYEYILRHDNLLGRSPDDARIQYWTPNKEIFKFPYANEYVLDECHKRGIDVNFGWELLEIKYNHIHEKIGVFRNVDTGATIEKAFSGMSVNPPHKPQKEVLESGLADSNGLIDVNPYTLQHNRYENVFSFGSAANIPTTRTQHATMAQAPIVKHNVQQFLKGKELNAIYDGYTYMPLL